MRPGAGPGRLVGGDDPHRGPCPREPGPGNAEREHALRVPVQGPVPEGVFLPGGVRPDGVRHRPPGWNWGRTRRRKVSFGPSISTLLSRRSVRLSIPTLRTGWCSTAGIPSRSWMQPSWRRASSGRRRRSGDGWTARPAGTWSMPGRPPGRPGEASMWARTMPCDPVFRRFPFLSSRQAFRR